MKKTISIPKSNTDNIRELKMRQSELERHNKKLEFTKQNLKKSEEKFRSLVWDMQVGVLIQGPRAEIILSNPKALELLGLSESQLLGKTSFDPDWNVVHEDGSPFPGPTHPVPQVIATLLPVRDVIMGVFRPSKNDMVWLKVDAEPQLNADGSLKQVVCTFTDVTLPKSMEKALRESEERYALALDAINDGLWDWNVPSGEAFFSPSYYSILGYNFGEFPADYGSWRLLVHSEDLKDAETKLQKSIETGIGFNIDFRMKQKSGKWLWVSTRGKVVEHDSGGKALRMVGTLSDISERKQLENTQNFLLQSFNSLSNENFFQTLAKYLAETLMMDYVCIDRLEGDGLTAQTVAVYNDGEFEPDVKYSLKDTPCGAVVGQIICCYPENVCQLFPEDEALQELKAVSYIGTTLWSFDGNPIGIIAVIGHNPLVNISLSEAVLKLVAIRAASELERNKAHNEVKESAKKLQQLNTDKDRFMSILAHDLRSPFSALLGLSEFLVENAERLDHSEINNLSTHINKTVVNTFSLLEDILLWAKTQSGKIPFSPQNVYFNNVCKEILNIHSEGAGAKNVILNYMASSEIKVFADIDMLKTVLRNLVSNAIKFTIPGGKIEIRAEQTSSEVTISIVDNGVGISPEVLTKLFDISQVYTSKGTQDEAGTGLGLIVCKEFVEKNGGIIWVESEFGKGSSFRFTLPIGKG